MIDKKCFDMLGDEIYQRDKSISFLNSDLIRHMDFLFKYEDELILINNQLKELFDKEEKYQKKKGFINVNKLYNNNINNFIYIKFKNDKESFRHTKNTLLDIRFNIDKKSLSRQLILKNIANISNEINNINTKINFLTDGYFVD